MNLFHLLKQPSQTEPEDTLIDALAKENDRLQAELSLRQNSYDELKELLASVEALKAGYENHISSLNREREQYRALSRDMAGLKKTYQDAIKRFTRELQAGKSAAPGYTERRHCP